MLETVKHLMSLAQIEHYKRAIVAIFILSFFCAHIVPSVFLILLLLTPLAPVVVLYMAWLLVFDWESPTSAWFGPSARRSNYCRTARMWNYFRDFFPVTLVKTADLDPKSNYIFCYHPHGVFAVGVFANFATEATGVSEQYPGLTIWPMTMPVVFSAPVMREWLMLLGARSVTTAGCRSMLSRGPGHSIALVPGGTRDMLVAKPGEAKTAIRKRKGFVRLALETGSPLVPVYGFGENELYDPPKSSFLRRFQTYCTEKFGMCYPFFQGDELARMLPRRKPLHTVVGASLKLPEMEEPSEADVEHWHGVYLEKLTELFDQHKEQYGYGPEKKLEFV
ncbi:diacylglycerol O-acyltransferase 2-like [Sycon ciliatum]|uniref:diacylglycerol O-acyltransferase 2-like n=1 Tax=Sycon ciliatum TaxID=27933 RepID=UPI0020A92F3D|eukprot:scpid83383/ scgid7838/ Diacylglycerol O-acyltransferase 2; Diglyceride acyltransferase 2